VHSATCDREGTEGDFKLYGRALDVEDRSLRDAYADATFARINWRPSEPYHLFSVDIGSAGFVVFGRERYGLAWDPATGLRRFGMGHA
jgi:hypothetical protein